MGSSKGNGGLLAMALLVIALAGHIACATASNFTGVLVEGRSTLSSILEASTPIACHSGSDITEKLLSGITFYCRSLEEKPVIVANTGHGMVSAARTGQLLLLFAPLTQLVVHYSNAGTPNLDLKLGDVLIAGQVAHTGILYWQNLKSKENKGRADLRFADYTASTFLCREIGNKLNKVWYRDAQVIYSPGNTEAVFWVPTEGSGAAINVNLTNCADVDGSTKCLSYTPTVVSDGGNGCSSDILVENLGYAQFLSSSFSCQAIDRGAAAVALVLTRAQVPLVSVKTVSNYAGIEPGPDNEDKPVLKQIGHQNAVAVIKAIVKNA